MSAADRIGTLGNILQTCVEGKESIADALTSKGVATDPADSFDTMAVNVGLIDGGRLPEKRVHCVLPREMNLKEILAEYPIPYTITNGFVFLEAISDNAPTKGTGTSNYNIFLFADGVGVAILSNYRNSIEPINTMPIVATLSSAAANYFALSNGTITSSASTNSARYYPVGTIFKTWEFESVLPKQ